MSEERSKRSRRSSAASILLPGSSLRLRAGRGGEGFWTGMIPLLAGAVLFAAAWPLYGFGQLVEDVSALRQHAEQGAAKNSAPAETFGDLPEL